MFSTWKLIARGAFNGVLLWKRPIPRWFPHLWPLKSGPANLPRRLVAGGETVYVTLGVEAPVTALDAGSGRQLREYANTAGAEELILQDGVLLVLVNRTLLDLERDLAEDPEEGKSRDRRTTYSPQMARIWAGVRSKRWTHGNRTIRAFDAQSGRVLWEKPTPVLPLTLAADRDRVYFHNGESVAALERATGKPLWSSEPVPVRGSIARTGYSPAVSRAASAASGAVEPNPPAGFWSPTTRRCSVTAANRVSTAGHRSSTIICTLRRKPPEALPTRKRPWLSTSATRRASTPRTNHSPLPHGSKRTPGTAPCSSAAPTSTVSP